MKKYQVRLLPLADEKLETLSRYIAETYGAPDTALDYHETIMKKLQTLREFPKRYPLARKEPERSQFVHLCPVGKYTVIFHIQEDLVEVSDILPSSSSCFTVRGINRINPHPFP